MRRRQVRDQFLRTVHVRHPKERSLHRLRGPVDAAMVGPSAVPPDRFRNSTSFSELQTGYIAQESGTAPEKAARPYREYLDQPLCLASHGLGR